MTTKALPAVMKVTVGTSRRREATLARTLQVPAHATYSSTGACQPGAQQGVEVEPRIAEGRAGDVEHRLLLVRSSLHDGDLAPSGLYVGGGGGEGDVHVRHVEAGLGQGPDRRHVLHRDLCVVEG